ncbi:hypothetical protein D3P07_10685 [Paenibacillus sp. 1011MAR3C5]|uniref:hypothetical protein n=1 Tax=Paenibacillus sp. 1011MAR3C5 TaxID=1675787 RepID=UPI000E6C3622|nr:hypothetical protein [Paenibacillus sp. 1011MAR3C5]RJE88462.1 hypothetical protein D3P07_10685 [Paenibacillus sp. 1011MAR3C5]
MGKGTKPEAKLSQWDALSLESLKTQGWTDEELITRVLEGNLPKDDSKFKFDYAGLAALAAEQAETFTQAVRDGYQIKYNTIRGIHSWILIVFGLEAELVLESGAEAVIASLSEEEASRLESVLSFGWTLNLQENDASAAEGKQLYKIVPVQG